MDTDVPYEIHEEDGRYSISEELFEGLFHNDGVLRDIWLEDSPGVARTRFIKALYSMGYPWSLAGDDEPDESEFEAQDKTINHPVKIMLPGNIHVNAWLFDTDTLDIELDIHPRELTVENVGHVFEFVKAVGVSTSLDVSLGRSGSESHVRYEPNTDTFSVQITREMVLSIIESDRRLEEGFKRWKKNNENH